MRWWYSHRLPLSDIYYMYQIYRSNELFLYGTVERGCEVLATFGPVDADKNSTDIGNSKEIDLASLNIPLDWKSPVVKEEYSGE